MEKGLTATTEALMMAEGEPAGKLREPAALPGERNAALRAAFAELSSRCQRLLGLLASDPPISYAEISAVLQMPVGSIGPQRARYLERMRKSLGELGEVGVRWAGGEQRA